MKPLFESIKTPRLPATQCIGYKPRPRPSASKRGYGRAWRRRRKEHLELFPWCVDCLAAGKQTKAIDVDHFIPREEGGSDEHSNLRSRCHSHHSSKTCKYDGGFGNQKRPSARK